MLKFKYRVRYTCVTSPIGQYEEVLFDNKREAVSFARDFRKLMRGRSAEIDITSVGDITCIADLMHA